MKSLPPLHDSDIFPGTHDLDPSSFTHRQAARAIVSNNLGEIAILHVTTHNYHKLPGGGIERGETAEEALRRELVEEIGCEVEIILKIAEIVEYRNQQEMVQTSYCYTAKQAGEQKEPSYTEKEIADGMSIVWAADIKEAINLLSQDRPTNYSGKFIRQRDLQLLKTATSA